MSNKVKMIIGLQVAICIMVLVFGVTVVRAEESKIQLTWEQEQDDRITGWNVYHSMDLDVPHNEWELFTNIEYSGNTSDTYQAEETLPVTKGEKETHYFYMTSHDAEGNESEPSNVASITIDLTPLPAPGDVSVEHLVIDVEPQE